RISASPCRCRNIVCIFPVAHPADQQLTFSNTEDRKLLIGWMSNWEYANDVPASTWRSGNTIVRELGLAKEGDKWLLTSTPVSEIDKVSEVTTKSKSVELANE